MATFTFYTNPMSRGQIVRWALQEVNADYDQHLVDWGDKSAEFLATNPMAKVPALVHHSDTGDHIVTEAAAICHYLAEMQPDADLLPQEDEKADYFRYFFFAAGPVEQAITAKAMGWEVPAERTVMAGFGNYDMTINTLDKMLENRDYVCGKRFTMADVYFGSQIDWGLQFGTIAERDNFVNYAQRLRDRPAYQAAKAIDAELIEAAQPAA